MTAALAPARPGAAAGQATFTALAARETRRFVLNPVFLFAVALAAYTLWSGQRGTVTEIDGANTISAVCFGGFGMMAAYWLTRSMHASEPVVGATPVTLPARTAALCAIAVLVALLRGAEGRVRSRVIRALGITGAAAVILLVLAGTGGFTHAVTT